MPYRDYRMPGVDVVVQRQEASSNTTLTEFLPVFIGKGLTSKSKTVTLEALGADTTNFPEVTFDWSAAGNVNVQMFSETEFSIASLSIHKEIVPGTPITLLEEGIDYEVVSTAVLRESEGLIRTTVNVLNVDVADTDLVYDLNIDMQNTNYDYDLRMVTMDDRYYLKDIFGSFRIEENGTEMFNDLAIAAEIAFRLGVQRFYYLEVPRDYGSEPTAADFVGILDRIYHHKNAYRIVPLTTDETVAGALNGFTTSLSNPVDRREIVGFATYDVSQVTDMNDISELVEKIGGFSESLNNERINNVFGFSTVELNIESQRYVLPPYFATLAIALYDTVIGMASPLSAHEINVFSKLNGPRFRPRDWNKLAQYGVFIIHQPEVNGPMVIRHQLTTKQSDSAEYQEYSIIKNFDAVTKRLRDRLSPYAGKMNITDGYMEKLEAALSAGIEEVKELGWAKELREVTPWALRQVGTSTNGMAQVENRNLVSKFEMDPVYPANNLDLVLIV